MLKLDAHGLEAVSDDRADERCDEIIKRVAAAERQLVFGPADTPKSLAEKFAVFEQMMSDREIVGCPTDNRHMAMLASLKADLHHLLGGQA